jgi:hypothetical protein
LAASTYRVSEVRGPALIADGYHAGCSCVRLRLSQDEPDWTVEGLLVRLVEQDPYGCRRLLVVGNEPEIQWDQQLADAVRAAGFAVHLATAGTQPVSAAVDWLTISPTPHLHGPGTGLDTELRPSEVVLLVGKDVTDDLLATYERHWDCDHLFLRPVGGAAGADSLERALELVHRRPWWRVTIPLVED